MGVCPSCGRELPGAFPFCPFCGSPVEAAPAPVPTLERKVVTALFCDLVGSTAAAEGADPEDVRARLGTFHRVLRERLEAFGGTVEKFAGDAVLAVFGAPVSHEDDAERAVRAGLSILDHLAALNDREPSLALHVRVGVNTGESVVDLSASSGQGDAFVFGDVVNTAARLQASADVDSVVVGEQTHRATRDAVVYEALEDVAAKGKSEPLARWRAVRAASRLGVDVMREVSSRMVGRDEELARVCAAFDRCCEGCRTELVLLLGDPGVGKSRLVGELFAHTDRRPELVTWRQGRCPPYGDGITYGALGEIVKAHAGIEPEDDAETATAKLVGILPAGDDLERLKARTLPLLGIESGVAASPVDSHQAWCEVIAHLASGGPLVLVVEDLHWADAAMLDFVRALAAADLGVPLLVVCTARPLLLEKDASWADPAPGKEVVRIGPLTDDETAELVSALLDRAELPETTRAAILERAVGNPLYAEEFVRLLRDSGLLDDDGALKPGAEVTIPDGVTALITARLDALPARDKAVLQAAAVVGKVFSVDEVAGILDDDAAALSDVLGRLHATEYVRTTRRTSGDAALEYSFWHVLVRDVAYAGLARSTRARLHASFVDWLTATSTRAEDVAELAVHHAEQALDLARSISDDALASRMVPVVAEQATVAGERLLALDGRAAERMIARAYDLTSTDSPEWIHVAALRTQSLFLVNDAAECSVVGRRVHDAVLADVGLLDSVTVFAALVDVTNATFMSDAGWSPDILTIFQRYLASPGPTSPGRVAVMGYTANYRVLLETDRDLEEGVRLARAAVEQAHALGTWSSLAEATVELGRTLLGEADRLPALLREVHAERGRGRPTYVVLAYVWAVVATLLHEGPQASLDLRPEAEAFERERGLDVLEAVDSPIRQLVALGRLGEAREVVRRQGWDSAVPAFVADDVLWLSLLLGQPHGPARDVVVSLLGAAEAAPPGSADLMLQRGLGLRSILGAADLAAGRRGPAEEHARAVDPAELARLRMFAQDVTRVARLWLELGMEDRLMSLEPLLSRRTTWEQHNAATVHAMVLESQGRLIEAAHAYAEAEAAWTAFTHHLEAAFAVLGRGRALLAAGEPGGTAYVDEARARFAGMGAAAMVAQCDELLSAAGS